MSFWGLAAMLFFSCGALVWIGAITSLLLSLFLSYHFNNCAFNYLGIHLSLL